MNRVLLCGLAVVVAAAMRPSVASAQACENLVSMAVSGATVTLAQVVPPGAFPPPPGRGGTGGASIYASLPAFCRVAATLKPSSQSDIRMEVWMPTAAWNGKLQVVGNGGFAGTISYPAMATALAAGYAAASTDTGHTGPASNTFATRDALIDFAHRAIHETTVAAKRVVDGLYGRGPRFSYFNGCSTGGRQALTAAQRYPEDFDGIIAGAPASYSSKQTFGQIWIYQATASPERELPRETLQLVHDAVMNACDALDGVQDGVLENPLACRFDPQVLACTEDNGGASCLTTPQVEAVRTIYAGASNPRTGEPIFPGLERGSELGWSPNPVGYAVDYFRYLVFNDPDWDPRSLDFDAHLALASRTENQIFDANDPDLSQFTSRGGKLIMYQGWAEPGIPPRNIVTYYENVLAETPNAREAVRLFMVPGMGHCGGGNGTSTFDMISVLDRWREAGEAPDRISASRVQEGRANRTRPLCPWPQVAAYRGSGSIDDETSFVCK
jgi:feruloyl esterase